MAQSENGSVKWRAVQGNDNWEGLLEPLDNDLREAILLYGDLTQATYDAFNSDPHSKFCGSSRYGKKDFFHKVSLATGDDEWDYEVTRFLYATSRFELPQAFMMKSLSREAWSRESNWIGYIAVATDRGKQRLGRREIVVAWRGTIRDLEWADVFNPTLVSIAPILSQEPRHDQDHHWYDKVLHLGDEEEPKVMNGWYVIYTSTDPKSPFTKTSAREQFLAEIKRLVELYKDEDVSISLVGHSLGAALAILSGFDIVQSGLSSVPGKPNIPVTAFVVGCPGVGNAAFKKRFEALPGLRALRIVNEIDLIPHYPGKLLMSDHVGSHLEIDTRKSPYLKDSKNPSDWHNLQAQLHIVAGWQGTEKPLKFEGNRSVALVNKSCDFLKEECLIPASWWVEKNKGMVQDEKGLWALADPPEDDVPHPEEDSPPPAEQLINSSVKSANNVLP